MATFSERDLLAFKRRQKKLLEKEVAEQPHPSDAEDIAEDSSATEPGLVRNKRQRVNSPPAITQTSPLATVAASSSPACSPPRQSPAVVIPPPQDEGMGVKNSEPHHLDSLWGENVDYADFIDQRVLLPGDLNRLSDLGTHQGLKVAMSSCLQIAAIVRNVDKELTGFDAAKKKMQKDIDDAKRRCNKYAEIAKNVRLELERKGQEEERLKKQIADLEGDLERKKQLIVEKQNTLDNTLHILEEKQNALNDKESTLETTLAEVGSLKEKMAADSSKSGKMILKLKGDLVLQFENGFNKAIRQINHFVPSFDTSVMGVFKMFENGQWVEPAEEEDEEE